jgi:hypothetical protein
MNAPSNCARRLKTRFLSNMSHEFRTPLNSILALSRLLLDRIDGELTPEQERQVGYVRRSAESLLELVNDLLDLAKVEAGKVEVKATSFTVSNLFGALRGALRPLQVSPSVELIFDRADDMPELFTDEAKVARILRDGPHRRNDGNYWREVCQVEALPLLARRRPGLSREACDARDSLSLSGEISRISAGVRVEMDDRGILECRRGNERQAQLLEKKLGTLKIQVKRVRTDTQGIPFYSKLLGGSDVSPARERSGETRIDECLPYLLMLTQGPHPTPC